MYTLIIPGKPETASRPRVMRWSTFDPKDKIKRSLKPLIAKLWHSEILTGPLKMKFIFHMPIPKGTSKKKTLELIGAPYLKKFDVDNLVKFYMDILLGICYKDDSIVYHIEALKVYDLEPKTLITIETCQ